MKSTFLCISFLLVTAFPCDSASAQKVPRLVHVFVALADNAHQGIVPVPAALGNGDDPEKNLYWGAAFGVKTFFGKSNDWIQLSYAPGVDNRILQSVTFYHRKSDTFLIADAYRGSEIKSALSDFFAAAAGKERTASFEFSSKGEKRTIKAEADLVVYVGHDGLMDFSLEKTYPGEKLPKRQAIVLACASKQYFGAPLRQTGAAPLLWTTNLMAPEAYTLKAALDGWIAGETDEEIRQRAAAAYAQYQKISKGAALKLFTTGW